MNLKSVWITCLLLVANPAAALPILSADGSLLTGVIANGETFEVIIGDAVLGDIYPASTVGQPGWFDLADSIKQGIVEALDMLLTPASAGDINGCTAGATVFGIDLGCIILIPDLLDLSSVTPHFRDTNAAQITAAGLVTRSTISNLIAVEAELDTGGFGNLTFAQFRRVDSTVPVPSTLLLLIAGTAALVRFRSRESPPTGARSCGDCSL
ncbi:MAG: hypothetical protein NXI15_17745 [Gammaproteobacteria bacterium]|nr:hypothetical protein [Gammaproteobacteria bacterium]